MAEERGFQTNVTGAKALGQEPAVQTGERGQGRHRTAPLVGWGPLGLEQPRRWSSSLQHVEGACGELQGHPPGDDE